MDGVQEQGRPVNGQMVNKVNEMMEDMDVIKRELRDIKDVMIPKLLEDNSRLQRENMIMKAELNKLSGISDMVQDMHRVKEAVEVTSHALTQRMTIVESEVKTAKEGVATANLDKDKVVEEAKRSYAAAVNAAKLGDKKMLELQTAMEAVEAVAQEAMKTRTEPTTSQAQHTAPRAPAVVATVIVKMPKNHKLLSKAAASKDAMGDIARAKHLNSHMFKAMADFADVEAPRAYKAYQLPNYQGSMTMWKVHMMTPGDVDLLFMLKVNLKKLEDYSTVFIVPDYDKDTRDARTKLYKRASGYVEERCGEGWRIKWTDVLQITATGPNGDGRHIFSASDGPDRPAARARAGNMA